MSEPIQLSWHQPKGMIWATFQEVYKRESKQHLWHELSVPYDQQRRPRRCA